jgi:hypothetical protein
MQIHYPITGIGFYCGCTLASASSLLQVLHSSLQLTRHVLGASVLAPLDARWKRLAVAAGMEDDTQGGFKFFSFFSRALQLQHAGWVAVGRPCPCNRNMLCPCRAMRSKV